MVETGGVGTTGLVTVGELSRQTGVPIKSLRRYTDWGLIFTAGRSEANYRLFDSTALWCVEFIVDARRLGLTLAEIRELSLVFQRYPHSFGPRLAQKFEASRTRLRERIAQLQETLQRIDEFESEHRDELESSSGSLKPDDSKNVGRGLDPHPRVSP